jgi:hypothetical protein
MNAKSQKFILLYSCLLTLVLIGHSSFQIAGARQHLRPSIQHNEPTVSHSSAAIKPSVTETSFASDRLSDDGKSTMPSRGAIWEKIDSGDFKQFVKNLRATGCPEQTIRDIVVAELREEFNQRRAEALMREPIPYWEGGYGVDEDQLPELGSISTQEHEMATDLLGKEGSRGLSHPTIEEIAGVRLGAELTGKQQIVESLAERMSNQLSTLMDTPPGIEAPAGQNDRFNDITQSFESALNQVLTPEERQAYDLRHSTAAAAVRESLRESGVSVTEAEFSELYHARRQFEELSKSAKNQTIDVTPAWEAYMAASQRVLGEERSWKLHPPASS